MRTHHWPYVRQTYTGGRKPGCRREERDGRKGWKGTYLARPVRIGMHMTVLGEVVWRRAQKSVDMRVNVHAHVDMLSLVWRVWQMRSNALTSMSMCTCALTCTHMLFGMCV